MTKYSNMVMFWLDEFMPEKDVYKLSEQENKNNIIIDISVKKQHLGKIIGRNGNIIGSLRTFLNAIAKKDKKNIKILVKEM